MAARPTDPLANPVLPLAVVAFVAAEWGLRQGSAPAVALALAISVLLAAALLWSRLGAASVHAERALAPRAYEDEQIPVSFTVENRGGLPIVGLEIADQFPADRALRKSAIVFPALEGRTRVEARYLADCDAKRGLYAVGPLSVVASDPLGLFSTAREIGQVDRLLVYPAVIPLSRLLVGAGGTRFDAASRLAGLAGAGIEFLGTREYRPGDSLRTVHWPSVARTGRLVVKELEETAAADVAILFDLSRMAARGLGRVSTVEYAIRVAASVAAHVTRGPNRVRLLARGQRPQDVPPGSGDGHLALLLEALALCKADGDQPFASLLAEAAATLARGATCVAIFSAVEPDLRPIADALALFRARGVHLIAVLIDGRSFLKLYDEQARTDRTAASAEEAASALLAEGATVVTIARGEDIARRFDVASDAARPLERASPTAAGAPGGAP